MCIRDSYDHTVQLMDFVESYKEITTGLMELYHSCLLYTSPSPRDS